MLTTESPARRRAVKRESKLHRYRSIHEDAGPGTARIPCGSILLWLFLAASITLAGMLTLHLLSPLLCGEHNLSCVEQALNQIHHWSRQSKLLVPCSSQHLGSLP